MQRPSVEMNIVQKGEKKNTYAMKEQSNIKTQDIVLHHITLIETMFTPCTRQTFTIKRGVIAAEVNLFKSFG